MDNQEVFYELDSLATRLGNWEPQMGKFIATRLNSLLKTRFLSSGIQNKTGALNSSIYARYNPTTKSIDLGVLMYGIFLSYGVGPGVKSGKIYKIDDWILDSLNGRPRGGNRFSYNPTYRKYGIPARKWLPSDEALEKIIEDFVKQYFNEDE